MAGSSSTLDRFSDSDSLVVYQRSGAVRKGTVAALMDHVRLNVSIPETTEIYATDAANTKKQTDATYIYWAWNRIDQTGYKAERRTLSTGDAAGETTGAGNFPADLTALSYS